MISLPLQFNLQAVTTVIVLKYKSDGASSLTSTRQ
jgi:hypothetical protein